MSQQNNGRYVWWRRWLCAIVGHRYMVWQNFGPQQRRVTCRRCAGDWAMHDGVRAFVPWDGEFAAMYEARGYHIRERS